MGYCSNHRWHVLDSVPFETSLAFFMEAWPHNPRPGLCYACIAYLYARPGALDDHRRVLLSELVVPEVPSLPPEPEYGAHGAVFFPFDELGIEEGVLGVDGTQPCASRGELVTWSGEQGDRLTGRFALEEGGERSLSIVAAHWPESGKLRLLLDGEPLPVSDLGGASLGETGAERWVLRSPFSRRLLSTRFEKRALEAGEHELVLECLTPGTFAFDYVWIR
jgi:hypothetical protein